MSKKAVCWVPVGKPDEKVCTVEDRPDVVFFGDSVGEFSGSSADFFQEARQYFTEQEPTIVQRPETSLWEIVQGMNAAKAAAGRLPLGDVHLVVHGSDTAWLIRPVPPPNGVEGDAEARARVADLMEANALSELEPVRARDRAQKASRAHRDLWQATELTTLDMMRLFRLQMDRVFPRLEAGVVDEFTRVILYSCDLGKVPNMLDAVSDVLGFSAKRARQRQDGPNATPRVYAPKAWVFFRWPGPGHDREIRLFHHLKRAAIPGDRRADYAPSASTRSSISDQLKIINPNADPQLIDRIVRVTNQWAPETNANSWVNLRLQVFPHPNTLMARLTGKVEEVTVTKEDASQEVELHYKREPGPSLDNRGYVVQDPPGVHKIVGVPASQLKKQSQEVFAQLFLWPDPTKPWHASKNWAFSSIEIVTDKGPPVTHTLKGSFRGTLVSYFTIVMDGAAPVQFDPEGPLFDVSTHESRNRRDGGYNLEGFRMADEVWKAGGKVYEYRRGVTREQELERDLTL